MDIKLPTRKRVDSYINKASNDIIQSELHEAHEIMYDAWECDNYFSIIQKIKKALRKSPLCADAYTYYSELTVDGIAKRKSYLETAVYAAEKALDAPIDEFKGSRWGLIETRPYMRARAGLASCLWELGRYDESLSHYQQLLELNPNDNQGLRYLLSTHYLELEKVSELEELLSQYPDEYSTFFSYTTALIAYRKSLSSADEKGNEAISCNRYVPGYLSEKIKQPENSNGYITVGAPDEAIEYVNSNLLAWMRTPGAIDWMATLKKKSEI